MRPARRGLGAAGAPPETTSAESMLDDVRERERTRERYLRLLTLFRPGLERVAATYTRGGVDRDDLLQQIALGLWRALPGFRGECSERTFVFRIAHNQGLVFAAKRRASAAHDPFDDSLGSDGAPDPESRLGEARAKARLWDAIRSLPEGQRAAITLALEDLSHEEIGEVLGLTANAVGVRLSRAREALRKAMESPRAARGSAEQAGGKR